MQEKDYSVLGLATIRRNRGISLEQIAEATKIGVRSLLAIEGGDFQKLPGGIYTTNTSITLQNNAAIRGKNVSLTSTSVTDVSFDASAASISAGLAVEAAEGLLAGIDVLGQARTGTGKTAAFVLPILERLDPNDTRTQALVLSPTRELSEQVANECHRLAANHEYRTAVFVGGRPLRPQLNELQKGVEIAIGTPGRVIDLTTAYDDQDLLHTEPITLQNQFLETTVGRVIFNDHLPKEMPFVNGLLRKKGLGVLCNYCYLRFGLETTELTRFRTGTQSPGSTSLARGPRSLPGRSQLPAARRKGARPQAPRSARRRRLLRRVPRRGGKSRADHAGPPQPLCPAQASRVLCRAAANE